jgi:hypothetical protein
MSVLMVAVAIVASLTLVACWTETWHAAYPNGAYGLHAPRCWKERYIVQFVYGITFASLLLPCQE